MLELRLDNIAKSYNGKTLFEGLSPRFHGGRLIAVRGQNGAGKSTLLRIIAGLVPPDNGSVSVLAKGTVIPDKTWRNRLGMVSPDLGLYGKLTANEHLVLFAKLRGIALSPDEADVNLEKVGLSSDTVRNTWVENFSTGMRQRLKLAILLVTDSHICLLDEPCSNLDEVGSRLVNEVVRRMTDGGKIVLWATNDKQEESLADEVLYLG